MLESRVLGSRVLESWVHEFGAIACCGTADILFSKGQMQSCTWILVRIAGELIILIAQ